MDTLYELPSPDTPGLWQRSLSLLRRNRDFRLFFLGQLVSFGGDWFLVVALSDYVYRTTHSSALVAAMFVAYNLPYGFVSFVGGTLADRLDRRRLMIGTNVVMGILALGFFGVRGHGRLWLAFALAAGISAVSALFEPAASAAVPNLVDPADLAPANALSGSSWGTMLAVGAGVGGLVVGAFGDTVGYLVDALSFFASAALLVWVRRPTSRPREAHHEHPGMLRATREAFAYSRRDHRLLAMYAARAGAGFSLGVVALLPVIALSVYHRGDLGTGVLFAFRGAGSLIGPFLVRSFLRRDRFGRLLAAIVWTPALFAALYGALPWAPDIWLAGVAAAAAHLAGGAQWTLATYAYQTVVPDHVLGRVFGFDGALITFTLAGSNALCGVFAGAFGVRAVMAGVAAVIVAYLAVVWMATRRLRRRAPEGPAGPR